MPRILYVEDHDDTRNAYTLMLQHAGYEVDTAADGRQALELAMAKPPDVMLVDLALPEMTGTQLIRALRSHHRFATTPVVILSALGSGKLFEEAETLNVSSVLLKSTANFNQINDAIQHALAHTHPISRTHSPEKWRRDSTSPL
jgi:CheY-like chemotaxis protein